MSATPELIAWERAALCLDCNRVSESKAFCLGCGSTALLNLPGVFGLNPCANEARDEEVRIA